MNEQIEIDLTTIQKAKQQVWIKATSKRKGHYREMKVGREEIEQKISKSDITKEYAVNIETLESNSVNFVVDGCEINIGISTGYFPRAGGKVKHFNGKVVIGRKDWVGKDAKDIPEIVDAVNKQYDELKGIKEGGDFSDVKISDDQNIISRVLEGYKSTMGSTTYLMLLSDAYLNRGVVEIPDMNNKFDKEYAGLKKYLVKYKDDKDYVELITERLEKLGDEKLFNKINLMGIHKKVIDKIDQTSADQFYSEVERTQEDLKERFSGKDTIILYRGVQGDYAKAIKSGIKKEGEVEIDTYSITSWTSDDTIAHDFSSRGKGVVIKKEFPIEDILFTHFTSPFIRTSDYVFGGTEEYEFIVGHKDKKMKVSEEEIV